MNILIVDDEEEIGMMVTKFLTREGLMAEYVTGISDARKRLENKKYDVFLLDLNLPDGTGLDLLPDIDNNNEKARRIAISAYEDLITEASMHQYGIHQFVRKPFTKNEIISAVFAKK